MRGYAVGGFKSLAEIIRVKYEHTRGMGQTIAALREYMRVGTNQNTEVAVKRAAPLNRFGIIFTPGIYIVLLLRLNNARNRQIEF